MTRRVEPVVAFVPLATVKRGPGEALEEIRRIYFTTERQTIDRDIVRAIELLKSLPSEADRERATVYMHGLDEMRREWSAGGGKKRPRRKPAARPTPRGR
jgi:hypothetical protein